MNKISKTAGAIIGVMAMVFTLTSCTNSETLNLDEPTGEVIVVAETYEQTVGEVYNHGKTAQELEEVNVNLVIALGDTGVDYPAALAVLEPVVPMDHAYVGNGNVEAKITQATKTLSYMLTNTAGDTLTADVDANKVKISPEGDTATIDRTGVTFTSTDNSTTGLSDLLNEQFATVGGEVKLYLTEDGWKVDMTTLIPDPNEAPATDGENVEND